MKGFVETPSTKAAADTANDACVALARILDLQEALHVENFHADVKQLFTRIITDQVNVHI